jgi:hypothetical protein
MRIRNTASLAVLALTLGAQIAGAQVIRSASGATADDILEARDAFRADLGGGDTGAGGFFGGVRREINWDGAGDAVSDPNFMPAEQFLGRGATFRTNGAGVMMSAKAVNPTATPILFSTISPVHANQFQAFSAERTFAPIGSNRLDVTFTVPGTQTPGVTRGLGVVFSDVDIPFTTSIEYFAIDGSSLGKFFVPSANGNRTFSFLGVDFEEPLVARAEIVLGNAPLNPFGELPPVVDTVITDDFIYGDPVAAEVSECVSDATTLCLLGGRFEVTVAFATTAGGEKKLGRVQRLAEDSGAVWFFSANNLEMLVKVLDGCAINDRFWFYAAAATDVELEITVRDTETGQESIHTKELGPPAPAITDTDAFATCN